ncbi:histidine phosphatase family protein [Nocardioides zeae]|uniref:Histidine phosphatase family protein n=1 Tax=Nocardioides imazamoxiresistens TaxID=3231893 RepID=A0ABU3PV09_9ACTN|nr:histidine phosphatase family protein [Nocardioides zeae]MDT9592677.1 histidine phosphatase family protein [Nocardioides zeae]
MSPRRDLVLLRHGKSDWSHDLPDTERPVGERGWRQAAAAGRWLATRGPALAPGTARAVVSTAVRARTTWVLASAALPAPPPVHHLDELYTCDAEDVAAVVAALPSAVLAVVVVGHEPALGDLARDLSGRDLRMRTSELAWFTWAGAWADVGPHAAGGPARLLAHGRPPDERTAPPPSGV